METKETQMAEDTMLSINLINISDDAIVSKNLYFNQTSCLLKLFS